MPRNRRKRVVGKREEITRQLREVALDELAQELHAEWRDRPDSADIPVVTTDEPEDHRA